MKTKSVRINKNELHQACSQALIQAELPIEHAELSAGILVKTDLIGIHTHGVVRLMPYVKKLRAGLINATPDLKIENPSTVIGIVDGDHALGSVVAMTGVKEAIRMAKENGIGFVTCRNSNLMGAGAPYVMEACDKGMMFMGGTNAFPSMAPTGGKEILLGNNPMFYGVPRSRGAHFVLDIAMGAAARGKIRAAQKRGEEIPLGWALDQNGKPTTDPEKGLKGYVMPIAGHKGYGLALAVDMFAGVLSGSGFGTGVLSLFQQWEQPQYVGHYFMAIDPTFFMEREKFDERCTTLLMQLKNSQTWNTAIPVIYPGELEAQQCEQNTKEGIPLDANDWESIRMLADGKSEVKIDNV